MPFFFNRFYENATGWLYDYDPPALPAALAAPLQPQAMEMPPELSSTP